LGNALSENWTVRTVLGDIPAAKLGATDSHTHVIRLAGPLVDGDGAFLLASPEKAIEELARFRGAGGGAVVDMTPSAPGRSTALLADVSRAAGVHVIAATGFVDWAMYPGTRAWMESVPVERLAGLIADEITEGADANNYTSPVVARGTERAGVIKIATGYQVITPLQQKLIQAAAAAHRMTGAPISVHTERGTCVLELVERLRAEQVQPESVLVAHTFHNPDPYYQRDMAQTGIYLIQDGPGRVHYAPESDTISQIERFLSDGFADRLLLAGDHSKRSYWTAYGGGPGFDYGLATFVRRLHRLGIPESVTRAMTVENPARALRIRPVGS
jgi:phosphotriesterase-related protein